MLQDAKYLISKFNRISQHNSKFVYFELSEMNKNLIAYQWNRIVIEDILQNRKEAMEHNEAHYEDGDGDLRIPHYESLFACLSDEIEYYERNRDEDWIVPYIRENLTTFLTMSSISEEFHSNIQFSKLYPMLEHRM